MMQALIRVFTSLRFTALLLALALIVVFVGTIAQVEQGLYQVQARFFRSLFIYVTLGDGPIRIPVFPGGYLIGGIMVINLIAVGLSRWKRGNTKFGLVLIHFGLALLLLGQLVTDSISVESALRFAEGETKNYSEDFHANELAVVDTTEADQDRLVSLPERLLAKQKPISLNTTPLTLSIQGYWRNAELLTQPREGAMASPADQGFGRGIFIAGKPPATRMDDRNLPAALVEIQAEGRSLGTWLVSSMITQPQAFEHADRSYQISLRPKRHYTPFTLSLLECRHDVYQGTEIPKNFSSRVEVHSPETDETRTVLIKMNHPLRYGGNTYYQYQMAAASSTSTLQVVRNATWLTPYISCALMTAGLLWQFLAHLIAFLRKPRHEA